MLRLRGGAEGIMHFDFQAGPDASLPRRTHGYSALLEERHGLPVRSAVILLRPEANLGSINGLYERSFPGRAGPYLTVRYQVIRVWELAPGPLPLAPISAVSASDLPGLIERLKERLDERRYRKVAGSRWTAVDILMGLRYQRALIEQLLRGVRAMKESVTYQAIVEEGVVKGRLEGVRQVLLNLGEDQFHAPPGPRDRARVESVNSIEMLNMLVRRVLHVRSWEELLADVPPPAPRPRRRKAR